MSEELHSAAEQVSVGVEAPTEAARLQLSPEKTKEITGILRSEPMFGIGEAMSSDSLSPQALAEVWSDPVVVDLLVKFSQLPDDAAKGAFAQSPAAGPLVQAIGTTKQVLSEQQSQIEAVDHQAAAADYLAEFEIEVRDVPAELEGKVLATLASVSKAGYDLQSLNEAELAEVNSILTNQIDNYEARLAAEAGAEEGEVVITDLDKQARAKAEEYLTVYAQQNGLDLSELSESIKTEIIADMTLQIAYRLEAGEGIKESELDSKIAENINTDSLRKVSSVAEEDVATSESKENIEDNEKFINKKLKELGAKPISTLIEEFKALDDLDEEQTRIGLKKLEAIQAKLALVASAGKTEAEQAVLAQLVATTPVKAWESAPTAIYASLINNIDNWLLM